MAVFINQFKKYFSVDWIFPENDYTRKKEDIPSRLFFENRENYTSFYIDIGTHHPYPFSNKLHFSQKGWQKIVIEPAAGSSNLFNLLSEAGINLNSTRDAAQGTPFFSHFKSIKTNSNTAETAAGSIPTPGAIIKTINVKEMPLATILDNNLPAGQTIDFLSLDVAGFDMRVLKSADWNRYCPLFIIVKVASGTKGDLAAICYFLIHINYEQVAKTDRALFFKYKGN